MPPKRQWPRLAEPFLCRRDVLETIFQARRLMKTGGRTVKLTCFISLMVALSAFPCCASATSAQETAAASKPQGDLAAMTVDQILAEFHDSQRTIVSKPAPERYYDLVNALRAAGEPLRQRLAAEFEGNAQTRIRAISVTAVLGQQARALVPQLVKAAGDNDAFMRMLAIGVLGNLKDPRAFDTILAATRDPAPGVRSAAVRLAAPALADAKFAVTVNALADADRNVRAAAVEQLNLMKDKRSAPYLALLLDDREVLHHESRNGVTTDSHPCDAAARALEHVVGGHYLVRAAANQQEQDALVQKWKTWWKEKGEAYERDLYAEPPVVRPLK
jgi:hypothetical protein